MAEPESLFGLPPGKPNFAVTVEGNVLLRWLPLDAPQGFAGQPIVQAVMTPERAREYGNMLLKKADQAEKRKEREEWLLPQQQQI